jgi:hypothetical protein
MLDQAVVNELLSIARQLASRPDGAVAAALITVGGMVSVAIITVFIQWLVTRTVIKNDMLKVMNQLSVTNKYQRNAEWRQAFLNATTEFLSVTDPDVCPTPKPSEFTPLILRIQLLLDMRNPAHNTLNELVNKLGICLSNRKTCDSVDVYKIHGAILETARDILIYH